MPLFKSIACTTLLSVGLAACVFAQNRTSIVDAKKNIPFIESTTPGDGAMNVDLGTVIEITFSLDMNNESINGTTFMLHPSSSDTMQNTNSDLWKDDSNSERSAINNPKDSWGNNTNAINGTIRYSDRVATFIPNQKLKKGTSYTFTLTTGVKSSENVPLEKAHNWNFITSSESDSLYEEKRKYSPKM